MRVKYNLFKSNNITVVNDQVIETEQLTTRCPKCMLSLQNLGDVHNEEDVVKVFDAIRFSFEREDNSEVFKYCPYCSTKLDYIAQVDRYFENGDEIILKS